MDDVWKGKLRVKKPEKEKMLSMRITQRVPFHPFHAGCHTWKRRWIR